MQDADLGKQMQFDVSGGDLSHGKLAYPYVHTLARNLVHDLRNRN